MQKLICLGLCVAIGFATQAMAAEWSGPYGTLSAGGGVGSQGQQGGVLVVQPAAAPAPVIPLPPPADGSYRTSGIVIGGGLGYALQFGAIVLGVEADASYSGVRGNGICGAPSAFLHGCGGGVDAVGTLRGKIGFDLPISFGPFGVMIFATGGAAFADLRAYDNLFGGSGRRIVPGWALGGGLELKLTPQISLRLEYLRIDLGRPGLFTAVPPNIERVRTETSTLRVGLSYYFSPSAMPRL